MNQVVRLNLIPTGIPPTVYASETDVGRTIKLEIFDGETAYTIPDGATVELHGTKPDNHSFDYRPTYSGSVVNAVTTEQMCAKEGTTECTLRIVSGDDINIGTLLFYLNVQRDALPEDADLSETDLKAVHEDIETARQTVKDTQAIKDSAVEETTEIKDSAVTETTNIANEAKATTKSYMDAAAASADAAAKSAAQAETASNSKSAFQYYYSLMDQTTDFTTDSDGKVTEINQTDSTNGNTCKTDFAYDDGGKVTTIAAEITTKDLTKYKRTDAFTYTDNSVSKIVTTFTEEESAANGNK